MSKSTPSQRDYQSKILNQIGLNPDDFISISVNWWRNPLNPHSLRLTNEGFNWLTRVAKLTSYKFKLPQGESIVGRQMLQLESSFLDPYFITGPNTLYVFGERDAIMLELHGGNLTAYLNSINS